jgi:hypothetical protein
MKLVGERRALSAVIFAFYALIYSMIAFASLVPEFNNAFFALASVYGLAFFALVAGYFWARWYSVGVGLYGVITAAVGMWQIGAEPILLFVGGTHLAATVMLWGEAMSGYYDGQTAWREKLHMDEGAVQRLGRSVIRAGVSLPFVLLYALAPKPPDQGAEIVLAVSALVLAGLGLRALVRMKTWGIFALGAAGTLMVVASLGELASADSHPLFVVRPMVAGALLLMAAAPWAAPAMRFLKAR